MAVARLPGMLERGKVTRAFLLKAQELWPDLCRPALAILRGEEPGDMDGAVVNKLRDILLDTLWAKPAERQRTARAQTPIHSTVVAGWTEDPDSSTIAQWLDHGAPMGFSDPIPSTGIFPEVPATRAELETYQFEAKSLEGWANYTSAEEENEELQKLIADYVKRGFCHLTDSLEDAERELGRLPIVNKLGLIVKDKVNDRGETVRKARIVWDMRRSGANSVCVQGERILLPRLLDLAAEITRKQRQNTEVWMAAVDIRDAFMNVPVSADRFALAAAKPESRPGDPLQLVIFDTLVFGAASSPTIWGRCAAWLARTIAAVEPEAGCQIYIDDPVFVLAGGIREAAKRLTTVLLWIAITGFPIKLSKATGGKHITWIGATVQIKDEEKEVEITIPADKIKKLRELTEKFMKKPVVGSKELRSYAGSLSFVAGLVPHLRPFLSSIWAVLPFNRGATDDGARTKGNSGRLIHVRRIAPALAWIRGLLTGKEAPLRRTLQAIKPNLEVTITTDACPFGLGGTLRVSGELKSAFSSDLPEEALNKFKANRGDAKHTTLWEALALLYACRVWLPQFQGTVRVRCKSDSLSLLQMLFKGRAKSPDLAVIAREFAIDLAKDRYSLHLLQHIPGITNIEADALSRVYAPYSPELPRSLEGVPRVAVAIGPDFWTVAI